MSSGSAKFKIIGALLAALVAVDLYVVFWYAPVNIEQGLVQKIFYWHVASAFVMLASFVLAAVMGALYLKKKRPIYDIWEEALVEVGFVFCTIVLITGPIWARPTWGVWWTWEPRLTTTLFLWLIYASYFILRGSFADPGKTRAYSAALTIFGCLDIPIIIFAVKLWRGAHPTVLDKRSNMPEEMWFTFFLTLVTVLLLAAFLVILRARIEKKLLKGRGML